MAADSDTVESGYKRDIAALDLVNDRRWNIMRPVSNTDIEQSGITQAPTPVPLQPPDFSSLQGPGRGVLLPEDRPVQPVNLEARMRPAPVNPMQQMLAQQAELYRTYGQQTQAVQDYQQQLLREQQAKISPITQQMQRLASSDPPKLPKLADEPKIPSMQPRSFLSGEGQQGLMSIVAGIGSIVQSMFALSAPVYGLQALTGAMEGWAEGDNNRAQRQWHEYEGHVARMVRENKKAMDVYELQRQSRFDDMQMLDAKLQAALHEAKLPEYALQFAQSGRETTAQMIDWSQKNLQHWQQYEHQNIMADLRAQQLQEMILQHRDTQAYHDALTNDREDRRKQFADREDRLRNQFKQMMEWRKTGPPAQMKGLETRLDGKITGVDQDLNAIDMRMNQIQKVENAVDLLASKGMLPSGPRKDQQVIAASKRNLYFGKDQQEVANAIQDVQRWGMALLAGQEMQMQYGRVAALRFKAMAEQEVGGVLNVVPKFWKDTLKDMRDFQTTARGNLQKERGMFLDMRDSIRSTQSAMPTIEWEPE